MTYVDEAIHEYGTNRDCPSLPRCHFFLRDGVLDFCGDSSHEYKGQKIPLKPIT